MNKNILVLSVPRLEPHRPPISASIVATVCKSAGHNVEQVDLNINFFHYCKQNNQDFFKYDAIWNRVSDPTVEQQQFIDTFIQDFAQGFAKKVYDYVMISVFATSNHYFTKLLLETIAPNRNFKILVGGSGAFSFVVGNTNKSFVTHAKNLGLIDDFISGEAELALVEYLQGNEYPGINNFDPVQISDLDQLPMISYDLLDLTAYDYLETRDIYIEGSRGCVRKCTYCDVAAFWPKYRYHSGEYNATQIIKNYEEHGIKHFYFTDSLVNGNLKMFSEMCNRLAAYPHINEIKWSGQFIFRSKKVVPPEHFEMIGKAGGNIFYVGVESGSDRVRRAMGKEFTNDDIDYQLEEFSKNGLRTTFLMFPGYVNETLEDHADTVNMFARWQKYVATGTINGVELGAPLMILNNTPLSASVDEMQMAFLESDKIATSSFWISGLNPDLDFPERVRRQLELYQTAAEYYWPIWRYENRTSELKESLIEFYKIKETAPKYKYRRFEISPWTGKIR